MTKTIKIISVLLCAVMVVSCCFVGCNTTTEIESLTFTQLLENLKEYFPEAHIAPYPEYEYHDISCIFFYEDETTSPFLRGINKNGIDTENILKKSFRLCGLKSQEDTIKILNATMPNFIKDWKDYDTNSFLSTARPNIDFTVWEKALCAYEISGIKVIPVNDPLFGLSIDVLF